VPGMVRTAEDPVDRPPSLLGVAALALYGGPTLGDLVQSEGAPSL